MGIFSRGKGVYGMKLGVPAGIASKVHTVKRKHEGGRWKAVQSVSEIRMHETVRLAKKPHVEGEIRHIDEERKRVEFNWQGNPIFAGIHEIKVLVRKKYK